MREPDAIAELEAVLARADAVNAAVLEVLDDAEELRHDLRSPVSLQPASANRKLSPIRVEIANSGRKRHVAIGPFVTSTYVSIAATCPDACPYKNHGCYSQRGSAHLTMNALDRAARGKTALRVTQAEVALIDRTFPRSVPQDGAKGGRDLRLHVGGEVSCQQGARALAGAARRWRARGGGVTWTFTKRWEEIDREAWGPISVLASCVTVADVDLAHRRGYAASIVVPEFPNGAASWQFASRRAVPCPAEATKRSTCASCRLCMDDARLRERGIVIAFEAHGADADEVRLRLPVVR